MIITHLGRYIKYCYKICFYSSIYFYLHIRVYFFLSLNKGQIVLSVVRNDAEWVLFGAVSGRIEPTVELIHCSHRTVYTTVTRWREAPVPQARAWSLWPVDQSDLQPNWSKPSAVLYSSESLNIANLLCIFAENDWIYCHWGSRPSIFTQLGINY